MPSTFDMPLEELFQYLGTNSRPGDFDVFWERALVEQEDVDPKIEIIPDPDFQTDHAECSHLWFTGVGGARVHAKMIQPKNVEGEHPAVLMFHGYSSDCGNWHDKLGFAAAGFTVAALDCRGQGGLSEDVGGVSGNTLNGHFIRGLNDCADNLLFRSIFMDTVQLARIVMSMPHVDAARVGTWGSSQGGALSLACAALEPRIKRVVALHPFLCDYLRVWQIGLAKDAYGELTKFFRHVDPLHKRQEELFGRLGYIDVQHHANRIKADVLFGATLDDRICPPSTQFAAYNKISSTKNIEVYPDFGHEPPFGFWDKAYTFMLGL